jgi:hypothetical protein
MRKLHILVATLCFSLVPLNFVYAEDDFIDETESTWGSIYSDDGFKKTFTIFRTADNFGIDDYGDKIEYTMEVQCSQKKLSVLLYGDPDIYPETGLGFKGTAQMKIDSGKITKQYFTSLKDFSGVAFNSPKVITAAISKSKATVSFKIPSSVNDDAVATFSKLDFNSYYGKFKSLGCLLK